LETIENDHYTTILGVSRAELTVKKSRFIGLAASVLTEQEAVVFIQKARSEFPGATHYCYAFIIWTGTRKLARSSDAGEPANSAGKPILQAIEHSEFQNIICVVVRYFGGIKLGVGGLIRAYGQTARDCLNNAQKTITVSYVLLQISVSYKHIGSLIRLISQLKGKIIDLEHSEIAKATVQIRGSMVPILRENIKAIESAVLVNTSK
jgi:uncharacterized YigZ family protein